MSVRYPEIRERLKTAARALSDEQLHDRLWLQGQRASFAEPGFDDALLIFVDELEMFGPGDLTGNVLADEREETSLEALQESIRELIDQIGAHGSIRDALATGGAWSRVKRRAGELERLLGRDG
jgi:hypothetical protein